jgi:hypothetical protein
VQRPVVLDDDESESANTNAASSDSNAKDDLGGAVSLKLNGTPGGDSVLAGGDNVLAGNNVLEGDNIFERDNVLKGDNILAGDNVLGDNIERLHSALVDLHSTIPICP